MDKGPPPPLAFAVHRQSPVLSNNDRAPPFFPHPEKPRNPIAKPRYCTSLSRPALFPSSFMIPVLGGSAGHWTHYSYNHDFTILY